MWPWLPQSLASSWLGGLKEGRLVSAEGHSFSGQRGGAC